MCKQQISAEESICYAIMDTEINIEPNESDTDENSEINMKSPPNKEMLETLSTLRRGVQYRTDKFYRIMIINNLFLQFSKF